MNMKQFLSLFLALLIFGTRVGLAINVHYCGSKIASISLAHNPSNCGMEMGEKEKPSFEKNFSKKTCCKDTTLLFQNDEPQKVSFEEAPNFKASIIGLVEVNFSKWIIPFIYTSKSENWSPPPPDQNKIILLQHRLVLYG